MATLRQQKLAQNIASGRFTVLKELLVSSGYTRKSAESVPGLLISQKGVQKELKKLENANDLERTARAATALILLTGPDKSALKAADMIFRALGTYR